MIPTGYEQREQQPNTQQAPTHQGPTMVTDVESVHYSELFGVDSQTAANWDKLYEDRPNQAGEPSFRLAGYSHNKALAQRQMNQMQQNNPTLKFSNTVVEHKMAAVALMEQMRNARSARVKMEQPSVPVAEKMDFQY